jgi:hypothetical protein
MRFFHSATSQSLKVATCRASRSVRDIHARDIHQDFLSYNGETVLSLWELF